MNEHDILHIIAENPSINQRKIAEKAKISLGQANFLIKKCVKKGLVKIEGQSPKSLQYNLTPKGIKEKAELTLQYIKLSYAAVLRLTDKIVEISRKYKEKGMLIYVLDFKDEMAEIVKIALDRAIVDYKFIDDISQINKEVKYVLYVWEDNDYGTLNVLNILA